MKYLSLFLLISIQSFAETDPSQGTLNGMRQTGDLVSVRLVPGEPVHFYVVGKEKAQIDFSQLKLRVKRLSPGPEKILSTKQIGNMFSLKEPLDQSQPTDIEITTQSSGKEESFKFHLNDAK